MNTVGQLWRWLLSLIRRGRLEREMEEEMHFHLDMQVEQNLETGMLPEEARQAARRQFGNQTWLKEASREMWSVRFIETLMQDLRYGARTLIKNPGFTVVAALTLTLGIGANTAIFSVVNSVLFRPLQYSNSDQLLQVWQTFPQLGSNQVTFSAPEFLDYKDQNRVFERIAAYRPQGFTLTTGAEPERLFGLRVSADLFPLLGVAPALGRVFLAEDDP